METFARDITPIVPPTPNSAPNGAAREVSIVGVASFLLRHRLVIVATSIITFLIVAGLGLSAPRTYSSTAAFIPQASKSPGGVAGLAAQLGVSVPSIEPGTSPSFYLELLRSPEVLGGLLDSRYVYRSDTGTVTGTLVGIFHPAGRTPGQQREVAIERLRSSLTSSVSDKTSVVTFSVRTTNPELSHLIATRLVDELNRFNLEQRQSQAAAERRFTEARLAEILVELRAAEDRMQAFLQRNREYRSAPDLVFEAERMQRDITLRQGLYAAMSQSVEQAKIEQVRDTPVITLIERPSVPANPDGRGLIRKGFLALWLGAGLGVVFAMLRAVFVRPVHAADVELAEFTMLRREVLRDLRHPLQALTRGSNVGRTS